MMTKTINKTKRTSVSIFFMLISLCLFSQNFATKTDNIRNSVVANINNNSVLFLSSLSTSLSAYTLDGKEIWNYKIDNPSVIFEILAEDINNDGNDDLLAIAGNGTVYCINSNGNLLWKYTPNHKTRLSEIAVVKNEGRIQIFAGGNDNQIYELDKNGKQVSSTKIKGVVRKIDSGNFLNADEETLFVMTYNHDKFRWEFMGILDPSTKKVLKEVSYRKKELTQLSKAMITDIQIADVNQDNKDDILFFGDRSWKPLCTVLDSDFNVVLEHIGTRKQIQRYAHSQGAFLPVTKEIMFQNGGILMVLDTKGNVKTTAGERYGKGVYSDFVYEPKSNHLIAAGTVDGGNVVQFYDLNKNNWHKTKYQKQGKMLIVEKNLSQLYKQVLDFKMPSYQKKSDKPWVMITKNKPDAKLSKLDGADVNFVIQKSPKESTDRSHLVPILGKIALKKDKRGKYKDSREDIVKLAKKHEANGQPFAFWAGHGNDPFYIQIETLEEVLRVAPTTCYGFVYAEMHDENDPRVIHFVKEYMPRLAKAIRKNNRAKLYFRYKNMFWAATSHLPLWKEMFFSKKYADILAPASEDTSNRIQDLNLVGRIGMFAGGYVNDFTMRLIDDNPTSWRPLTPGGQNSVSPYLRQGVMMAAYGARYGIIFSGGFVEEPGFNILFALMKSGVLPIVEKENMQSISSWHLIKGVDKKLVHSVDSHHKIDQYKKDDDNAVFSIAQMHWAGTNIPKNDFSKIALGVDYRWLSYMPEIPNGMVPIAPIESKEMLEKNNILFSISNGKKGFVNDEFISAKKYANDLKNIVEKGKNQLPILVKGAAWSVIKIDENHSRLILIDQGYIEPKDREVTITFQKGNPKSAKDILSKENLKISKGKLSLKVPAGSLRFIDVIY